MTLALAKSAATLYHKSKHKRTLVLYKPKSNLPLRPVMTGA